MKVVDLHGVRYCDVYGMLEKLCIEGEYPFVVITGNSITMKNVVEKVVTSFGLCSSEKLGNSGRLVINESR